MFFVLWFISPIYTLQLSELLYCNACIINLKNHEWTKTQKEAELKKFADAYPEIVLGEEIEKLHIQDASAKQTLKDLVAWPNPMTKPFLKRTEYE